MAKMASLREAYGKTLVELGKENPDIVVLDADLSPLHHDALSSPASSRTAFFECGIAEQNMMGIAAGLAASGKIPFASTFAVFCSGAVLRPDTHVDRPAAAQCENRDHARRHHRGRGRHLPPGHRGPGLACSLPGFTVIVPADAMETAQAVRLAAATSGPIYIRLCRPESPMIHEDNFAFVPGKAEQFRQGKQATIIAMGLMVAPALEAADRLKLDGIDCRVLNMATLQPADTQAIVRAAAETGAIVTVEEHLEHGGLGSIVAQTVARTRPVPVELVALRTYGESGKPAELLEKYGLNALSIEHSVRSVLLRKAA